MIKQGVTEGKNKHYIKRPTANIVWWPSNIYSEYFNRITALFTYVLQLLFRICMKKQYFTTAKIINVLIWSGFVLCMVSIPTCTSWILSMNMEFSGFSCLLGLWGRKVSFTLSFYVFVQLQKWAAVIHWVELRCEWKAYWYDLLLNMVNFHE